MVILWTEYLGIGMLVAGFSYRNRQAASCLEGLFAIVLWPLLIIREIVLVLR